MSGEVSAASGTQATGNSYTPASSGGSKSNRLNCIFNNNPMINPENIKFFGIFGNMFNPSGVNNEGSSSYVG